jgi:hypothetical protein
VVHNEIIYYTSIPINLENDAYEQIKSALAEINQILVLTNGDKRLYFRHKFICGK